MGQPRRPDQQFSPPIAVTPPSPSAEIVIARRVITVGANEALLVYNGSIAKGNLIADIAGTEFTDSSGNQVNPLAQFGVWSASTGEQLQHFGIDVDGNATVVGSDGVTRLAINNDPPAFIGYNDYGAITTYIDPVSSAIWQYEDLGSATQGKLLFAQAGKATTDPVTSQDVQLGLNIGQPAVGNVAAIVGAASAPQLITSAEGNAGGFSCYLGGAQPADYTTYTVSTDSTVQFSGSYDYTTDDAQVGTTYRVTIVGFGQAGSSAEELAITFSGAQAQNFTFPAAAGDDFRFIAVGEVFVTSLGASGTANYHIKVDFQDTTAVTSSSSQGYESSTFVTSSPSSLGLIAAWGANSSGQTATTEVTLWERLGP